MLQWKWLTFRQVPNKLYKRSTGVRVCVGPPLSDCKDYIPYVWDLLSYLTNDLLSYLTSDLLLPRERSYHCPPRVALTLIISDDLSLTSQTSKPKSFESWKVNSAKKPLRSRRPTAGPVNHRPSPRLPASSHPITLSRVDKAVSAINKVRNESFQAREVSEHPPEETSCCSRPLLPSVDRWIILLHWIPKDLFPTRKNTVAWSTVRLCWKERTVTTLREGKVSFRALPDDKLKVKFRLGRRAEVNFHSPDGKLKVNFRLVRHLRI